MSEKEKLLNFEKNIMPHLNAAYNLARWLLRNDQDAEDAVQEAYLRAFRFFGGFQEGNGRSWLLKIVRNSCFDLFKKRRESDRMETFDNELHDVQSEAPNPEVMLLQKVNFQLLKQAIEELPLEYREVLILREIQGLSYKEIAGIIDIRMGTVMSRLARARRKLYEFMTENKEA